MIAAIDVGSNAMRAVVAYIDAEGKPQPVDYQRAAVRLGQDVFQSGRISEETTARAVEAMTRFRQLLDHHHVERWRAVGTSALREAENSYEFISKINWATGLNLAAIGGDEEARLVFRAIAARESLKGRTALLIDIGGGSAEVSTVRNDRLVATESFKMGAVRLLELFGKQTGGDAGALAKLARGYVQATRHRVAFAMGKKKIDLCFGVGGNIEALADLRTLVLKKKNDGALGLQDLARLIDLLKGYTLEQRVEKLALRPDRADVVLPAAVVLDFLLSQAKVRQVRVPRVNLKDGLLIELARESTAPEQSLLRDQVLGAARELGARFLFDERHAETVAGFAMRIFDATSSIHGLGSEDRLLLEAAAWLHDIGQFIGITDHHKHSAYILGAAPVIGLTPVQRNVVANIVRYHHKSFPKLRHENFAALGDPDRARVRKLVAILRLADPLDFEHDSRLRLERIQLDPSEKRLTMQFGPEGDSILAKWAVYKHAGYFEDVFQVKVIVKNGDA
ncbi:MAG: Ppx/GppA family phosphatase [Myxococcales bacterium]|nr:MAG: Ppx/GppA family phosphatase [Myxococcales bacterium]